MSKGIERGKIVQSEDGKLFFVCVQCTCEFRTLSTFSIHQNDAHNAKKSPIRIDETTNPLFDAAHVTQCQKTFLTTPPQSTVRNTIDVRSPQQRDSNIETFGDKRGDKMNSTANVRNTGIRVQISQQPSGWTRNVMKTSEGNKCTNCGKMFVKVVSLKYHEFVCQMRVRCGHCHRTFADSSSLEMHMKDQCE